MGVYLLEADVMVFTVVFIVSKFSTCMVSEWWSVFLINESLLIWFICCF